MPEAFLCDAVRTAIGRYAARLLASAPTTRRRRRSRRWWRTV